MNTLSCKIVVIGFGNMGKALVRALQKKQPNAKIIVCERYPIEQDTSLSLDIDCKKITFFSYNDFNNPNKKLELTERDTILLCVKPQTFIETVKNWKEFLITQDSHPLVISILAGVSTEFLHCFFPIHTPIVRCMPNIAVTIEESSTALCASSSTAEKYLDRAKNIFNCVGKSWIVEENMLDAVTGLSGSGPAYIYMIIESLCDGGVKMGLSRQLSLELATQTVLGAAKHVQETKTHPAILRDQVATPGGTTISVIHELEKHGLRSMLISAVVAATEKSKSIGRLLEESLSR